jgi:uncharacterized protein (TIGR02271 family)
MAQQTIAAHFDKRSDAQAAVSKIEALGIARAHIRLLPETESTSYTRSGRSSYDRMRDEGGFWASLGDLFLPDEDRYAYAEGMSRGGVTVSVTAEQTQTTRVMDILEQHGAVDMNEREAAWRREGWSGYTAGSSVAAGSADSAAAAQAARGTAGTSRDGEVIPVVEEELRVGKRVVDHGRVRIRAYVREVPVQEQVTLRDETVRVERRPVDRPITDASDPNLFRERTIEAEERDEEAVVSKEVRVKEELVVHKDVQERTQTVQDKVRRTEVEVEDERAGRTGTTGTADPQRRR